MSDCLKWCDISGPNKSLEFAARFYNHEIQTGRQVVINDRKWPFRFALVRKFNLFVTGCGSAAAADHDTPEYAKLGAIQTRSWETSEGMDPNSYGLNSGTEPSQYKNGTTIIQTLVDIVSKNGN